MYLKGHLIFCRAANLHHQHPIENSTNHDPAAAWPGFARSKPGLFTFIFSHDCDELHVLPVAFNSKKMTLTTLPIQALGHAPGHAGADCCADWYFAFYLSYGL